jgi:hypothetical protein
LVEGQLLARFAPSHKVSTLGELFFRWPKYCYLNLRN